MKKRSIDRSMFYGASSKTFEFAKKLRNNLTPAEMLLWEKLNKKQLGVRFKPQHPIGHFIADFYCHSVKLVIEIDGGIHNRQKEYDINREAEIEKHEIKIIRFTNHDVFNNLDHVLNSIKMHLK